MARVKVTVTQPNKLVYSYNPPNTHTLYHPTVSHQQFYDNLSVHLILTINKIHEQQTYPVSVRGKRANKLVPVYSPDFDGFVIRARHKLLAIWRKVHSPYIALVGSERC